jgi:hypothetical protein
MIDIDRHEIRYKAGYFATVIRLCKVGMPQRIAWEMVEDALSEYWGLERYTTYRSYLAAKSAFYKAKEI